MGHFDVIDKISDLPLLSYKGVEDLIDKMSFIATCILLIACSLVVTLREYIMDPITCYMSHSPGGINLEKYVENFCWVQGTMSAKDKIPDTDELWKEFEKSRIVYYQWVPFMLLFQAALFFIPKILWTVFCSNMTGMDLNKLMETAANESIDSKKVAEKLAKLFVQHREYRKGKVHKIKSSIYGVMKCLIISKRFGTWLSCGYIFMKCLYLTNSISQIYLMQTFLQLNSHEEYSSNFGIEIAKNIFKGRHWDSTGVFPRVTYCYARVKHMAAINTVTAQCVLTANLFIEKIYIFLWFWIFLVIIFTSISLVTWICRLFMSSQYTGEIRKHLKLNQSELKSVEPFCKNFLRLDGMFLIYMLNINAGDLITGDVIFHLYNTYTKEYINYDFLKKDQNESFNLHNSKENCDLLKKLDV